MSLFTEITTFTLSDQWQFTDVLVGSYFRVVHLSQPLNSTGQLKESSAAIAQADITGFVYTQEDFSHQTDPQSFILEKPETLEVRKLGFRLLPGQTPWDIRLEALDTTLIPGAPGRKGDKGDPGSKGNKGDKGDPGDKGDKGDSDGGGTLIRGTKVYAGASFYGSGSSAVEWTAARFNDAQHFNRDQSRTKLTAITDGLYLIGFSLSTLDVPPTYTLAAHARLNGISSIQSLRNRVDRVQDSSKLRLQASEIHALNAGDYYELVIDCLNGGIYLAGDDAQDSLRFFMQKLG